MRKFVPIALGVLFFACADGDDPLEGSRAAVVYGVDDRTEVYSEPSDSELRAATANIVAIVPRERVDYTAEGQARIHAPTLANAEQVCPDEAFSQQPSAAECTGFLIDDNLVVTAGHCFLHAYDCQNYLFVFGYQYGSAAQQLDPLVIFECNRARVQQNDLDRTTNIRDYAVIELTRSVDGHRPLIARPIAPNVYEAVTVVSATEGLPLKIDRGAHILDPRTQAGDYFSLDSDTFHGSSGAPVLDEHGAVLGLIVRGNEDYVPSAAAGCLRVSRLPTPNLQDDLTITAMDGAVSLLDASEGSEDAATPQGGAAEQASYLLPAIGELCRGDYPSLRLCGIAPTCGDRICSPGESPGSCASDCQLSVSTPLDAGTSDADAATASIIGPTGDDAGTPDVGGRVMAPAARPLHPPDADGGGCRLAASGGEQSGWATFALLAFHFRRSGAKRRAEAARKRRGQTAVCGC